MVFNRDHLNFMPYCWRFQAKIADTAGGFRLDRGVSHCIKPHFKRDESRKKSVHQRTEVAYPMERHHVGVVRIVRLFVA